MNNPTVVNEFTTYAASLPFPVTKRWTLTWGFASFLSMAFAGGYPEATYKGPAASGNYDASGRNGVTIDTIVVHTTETTTAQSALDVFQDPSAGTSAHYIIDGSGTVWQVV